MTRIIAGSLGGRRIRTPGGAATRPTSDRVREALFSRLEASGELAGARVLDLYAGSGALGLEAASRGAATVLLVEADRTTARVIERNIADLGLERQCRVRAERVGTVLQRGPEGTAYDLVMLDPPYPRGEQEVAGDLDTLVTRGWLAQEALVVVERSVRSPAPSWPPVLVPLRSRSYGETALHLAEMGSAPEQA